MMTEKEICEKQRLLCNAEMYLQLRGAFWQAYDGGAFALARVTGYTVRPLKTVERYVLGFGKRRLEHVLELMKENGINVLRQEDGLMAFTGGDPSFDSCLVSSEDNERVINKTADYKALCQLRQELLAVNLADPLLTYASLAGIVRNLQIHSLSHLPMHEK